MKELQVKSSIEIEAQKKEKVELIKRNDTLKSELKLTQLESSE